MRKIFLSLIMIALFCSNAQAMGLEAGCYSRDSIDRSVLSIQNDYTSGNYSLGMTLNANMSNVDYGLESVVVKYLEYDDGTFGMRYAPLENMSFGYGMLLNDLNTLYYQPSFLTNDQSALRVYYDFGGFVLEGMGTYSHLYGVRLKDIGILNANFGIEYLSDANIVSREGFGRSAYGAYVELPLTDEFGLFAESASSSNGGQGDMAGASFDYDLIVAYSKIQIAAVSFNDRFIPGYFTTGYDINPVDFSSIESQGRRRYGTMSSINIGILGFIAIDYTNENYTDGGSANSGSVLITPIDRLGITGYVKELSFLKYRPVSNSDPNMIGGSIEYKMKSGIYVSLNYEKAITSEASKPYETYYFKTGYNF